VVVVPLSNILAKLKNKTTCNRVSGIAAVLCARSAGLLPSRKFICILSF